MIRIPVYLRDMYDTKHLVQAASGCQKDVDLICGKYIVNAKSMLGVFSLPTFDNVELSVEDDEEQELREKLESLNLIRE
nr:HPr family phosphocarrier protein [uncultured Anaerobutyricum sp.]